MSQDATEKMGSFTWSSLESLWTPSSFLKGDAKLRESPAPLMAFSRLGGSVPPLEQAERDLVVKPCHISQVFIKIFKWGHSAFKHNHFAEYLVIDTKYCL